MIAALRLSTNAVLLFGHDADWVRFRDCYLDDDNPTWIYGHTMRKGDGDFVAKRPHALNKNHIVAVQVIDEGPGYER